MNETPNLQALRARYALRAVDAWPSARRTAAVQRVQVLPVELRTQGLVVTLAMLMKDHAALAEDIARWLLEEAPYRPLAGVARDSTGGLAATLLRACVGADRGSFLAAQTEAVALVEHMKRFAAALPIDAPGDAP